MAEVLHSEFQMAVSLSVRIHLRQHITLIDVKNHSFDQAVDLGSSLLSRQWIEIMGP